MSRLFRDATGAALCARGSVVCIGAFDGLHLGHQALVQKTLSRARELGLDSVVISFEPLPREFFLRDRAPLRIASARDRYVRLAAVGVDLVGLLHFGAGLAAMTARQFIEGVLVQRLAAREVWVGPDFRFGHGRSGNLALLQTEGSSHGFSAGTIDSHHVDGERVSSSAVRHALAVGRLDLAARQLGRAYSMSGRVVHGKQLGRKLGYPTANLRCAGVRPALTGIFASWVHGVGDAPWPSVSSIGTRPTVAGTEHVLEAHLFGYDGDLYGERIEVEFAHKLRETEKFPDLPSLVAQMDCDAAQASALLGVSRPNLRKSA